MVGCVLYVCLCGYELGGVVCVVSVLLEVDRVRLYWCL